MNDPPLILVVDDVEQNVRLLEDILSAKEYQVITALSGEEALEILKSINPDLVLLDVVMPGISGLEVCRHIRSNPKLSTLPVVLVTALDSSEDRIKGIEAGADDFLSKPVSLHELLARVRSLLRIQSLFEKVQSQRAELKVWNEKLEEKVQVQLKEIERTSRLRNFLSPEIVDIIISEGLDSSLNSHRRKIAVIFCDLRGFTAFSDSAEPEETMEVLIRYHDEMAALIFDAGGTISHRAGDGIMIVFNDPIECTDPAKRAVLLAIEMRKKMILLTDEWKSLGYSLSYGIGISYGYATIGLIGDQGRLDYTAIGNVVNLASRLCDKAVDGEIFVCQKTFSAVNYMVELEEKLPARLKGFHSAVEIYDVKGLLENLQ